MVEHVEYFGEESDTQRTSLVPTLGVRDRATLIVIDGNDAGRVFSVSGEVLIGRGIQCTVQIDAPGVSRVHAKIIVEGRRYVLSDMSSRNGVFLNGERIATGELRHGDRLQLGPSSGLRFSLTDEQEERLARALYKSAVRDALTGVFHRGHFEERLAAEVAFAVRHHTDVALAMLDIDHFKQVNDQHGHPAGDLVLQQVCAAMTRAVRTEDVLCRYGGEEFAILARGISVEGAFAMAERIRAQMEATRVTWEGAVIPVTLSAGVATLAECADDRTGRHLVEIADSRLYAAKQAGRNRVVGQRDV